METQVIEKPEEKNLLSYFLQEKEEEKEEKDYPEFDDWAN
jgi:hypothetical protein